MPKKMIVDYLSNHQDEVIEKWTKEMRTQLDERSLSISMDSVYIETGKEFVGLVLSNLTQIEKQYKLKLQDFSDKVVQLGWPLTVVLAGLRALGRILFEGMQEKGTVTERNNMEVVYSFDTWMTPMQDEIVNNYASSWERTVSIQKIALQELSAPLIPVFEKISVMPLVGTIDTERAKQIMENLLNGIVQHRSEVVLIDITGVPVVDTMVAHHIIQAAEAVRLVGAKCMIVGIRPEIAQTIVSLGIDLTQILTTSTLQKGIQKALANTNRKIVELEGRRVRIPILKLADCLLVSIQWELDDQTALQFQEDLLQKIHETSARGVVIDITSIDFMDSFIAKVLGDVINMSKLMGAMVVITGIQPAVAITLIELGIRLEDVLTALDLEKGLETLQQELGD